MAYYSTRYFIRPGDTMDGIAKKRGFRSGKALMDFPPNIKLIKNVNDIKSGQEINIPYTKSLLLDIVVLSKQNTRDAFQLLNDFNSPLHLANLAFREALSDIADIFTLKDTVKGSVNINNLRKTMHQLYNTTLKLAKKLQRERVGTIVLDLLNKILGELAKGKSALESKDVKRALAVTKMVLRHLSMIKKLSDLRNPKNVVTTFTSTGFIEIGLYVGEVLASMGPNADWGLWVWGYEQYSGDIYKDLEAQAMKQTETAQFAISTVTKQLHLSVYS